MNCRDPERARRGAAPESKKVTLEPAWPEHTNRFMKDEGKGRAGTKKENRRERLSGGTHSARYMGWTESSSVSRLSINLNKVRSGLKFPPILKLNPVDLT